MYALKNKDQNAAYDRERYLKNANWISVSYVKDFAYICMMSAGLHMLSSNISPRDILENIFCSYAIHRLGPV